MWSVKMKQNTPAIYLQISTAQGPAECRIFARFVLGKLLAEAQAKGIDAELVTETADKHGILSAMLKLEGQKAESLAQAWQGTLQWICPSLVRPKHPRKNWYIGVFRLPDMPQTYEMPFENGIEFQTCRSGGKGGQHVNKTESAVRATHKESGISVRVESERSQHANKKLAVMLLAQKLAEHHAGQAGSFAQEQHAQLYQVERGNPKRTFVGAIFKEK